MFLAVRNERRQSILSMKGWLDRVKVSCDEATRLGMLNDRVLSGFDYS
jgi:hypothetical protein